METPFATRIYPGLVPRTGERRWSAPEYLPSESVASDMDVAPLLDHRRSKDEFFATSGQSPILDQTTFEGLTYYPPDATLVFSVDPDPVEPESVQIATTTGEQRTYTRVATVTVLVDGHDLTLSLYDTGHRGYFVPFRDATSGVETYGAGRYLDVSTNADDSLTIDFNYAYAPFCAYNPAYSCALPPVENWLDVPIRAGERTVET